MSEDDKKIIYILIGTGSKPLAGYTELTGEFIQMCVSELSHCKKNKSAAFVCGDFKIFYENTNNITYLILAMPSYPMAAAVSCIESLKKEFEDNLHGKNFENLPDYGLQKEMEQKLKMKYEYFNKNTELVSEHLEKLKGNMALFRDEVVKSADSLNLRGELIDEMSEKAENMANESNNYKKGAIKVKKFECGKKVYTIIAIIVVLIIIAGIITAIVLTN